MMEIENIRIEDYDYALPNERIANFPLTERDASKLLVYKNDCITEDIYKHIATYIPMNALLVFNNTRVINARLLFTKDTGGVIEIFVLKPYAVDIATAMQEKKSLQVSCFIGGASKWKPNTLLQKKLWIDGAEVLFTAKFIRKQEEAFIVELEWGTTHDFATIITYAGNVPLPPYIKRTTENMDEDRYQTIYAVHKGSVAAPTAGLHFTEAIFNSFSKKQISTDFVTLHVGAGTFKPVSSSTMQEHVMHEESIEVTMSLLKRIALQDTTIAIGTTSLRTLESLYWLGVKVLMNKSIASDALYLGQWDAYQLPSNCTKKECIEVLIEWLNQNNLATLHTTTQLLIAPGYSFKICSGLVTNFHQPKSTLLLLVAAATNGNWKKLYDFALEKDYRFLSYGDGCLLLWNNQI